MIPELTQFLINLLLIGAGLISLGVILESYADFLKKHKRLRVSIRKLDDGRYRVRYYWNAFEDHTEYVRAETLPAYLSDLALKSLEGEESK